MSTLVLIDVGNTRLKWARVTPRGALCAGGVIPTAHVTARWATAFACRHAGARFVAASVVPAVSAVLRGAIPAIMLVDGRTRGLPLAFAYPKPAEIGADRIAAAIGAGKPGPVIIIACGTATAISVVDRRGRFCGGAILPGLHAQMQALAHGTAQLALTAPASVPRALGRSTQAAIRTGVLLGWQDGVAGLVTRLKREVGPNARLLTTGGEARHLRGVRGLARAEFRPLLVFEGLRIMAGVLPH